MLQMRPRNNDDLNADYVPAADIRHCGAGMFKNIGKWLLAHRSAEGVISPALQSRLDEAGITFEQVFRALQGMVSGLEAHLLDPDSTLEGSLRASEFGQMPRAAQEFIAAQLGRQMVGMMVAALKESTPLGAMSKRDAVQQLHEAMALCLDQEAS